MQIAMPERLNAVVFQRGRLWVGVFLEHYLVAQAPTQGELINEMRRIITAHILISIENEEQPFEMFPPAPERYQRLLGKTTKPDISILFRLPEELRNAAVESELMLHEVRKSA